MGHHSWIVLLLDLCVGAGVNFRANVGTPTSTHSTSKNVHLQHIILYINQHKTYSCDSVSQGFHPLQDSREIKSIVQINPWATQHDAAHRRGKTTKNKSAACRRATQNNGWSQQHTHEQPCCQTLPLCNLWPMTEKGQGSWTHAIYHVSKWHHLMLEHNIEVY